jgi:hypothetical protein
MVDTRPQVPKVGDRIQLLRTVRLVAHVSKDYVNQGESIKPGEILIVREVNQSPATRRNPGSTPVTVGLPGGVGPQLVVKAAWIKIVERAATKSARGPAGKG